MSVRTDNEDRLPEEPLASPLPYERPRLGRVRLEADQVLATGCKSDQIGPNSGSDASCLVGPCSSVVGS